MFCCLVPLLLCVAFLALQSPELLVSGGSRTALIPSIAFPLIGWIVSVVGAQEPR